MVPFQKYIRCTARPSASLRLLKQDGRKTFLLKRPDQNSLLKPPSPFLLNPLKPRHYMQSGYEINWQLPFSISQLNKQNEIMFAFASTIKVGLKNP